MASSAHLLAANGRMVKQSSGHNFPPTVNKDVSISKDGRKVSNLIRFSCPFFRDKMLPSVINSIIGIVFLVY